MKRVWVEQTDITISGTGSRDGHPSTALWRSVAVEGALEDIVKFLAVKACPPSGSEGETSLGELMRRAGGDPRGYPQFVMELPQAFNLTLPLDLDLGEDQCTVT